ncbi:MAG: hypothetical protein MR868_13615 [Lachnospiraceae bacterium]|nr:hypothetical protein [Lachnospiraceae bacterium]
MVRQTIQKYRHHLLMFFGYLESRNLCREISKTVVLEWKEWLKGRIFFAFATRFLYQEEEGVRYYGYVGELTEEQFHEFVCRGI